MADASASAAVCVAAGALITPFCAAFGFDPTLLLGGLVGGFMGCVIVQTLIPDKGASTFRRAVALMIGSVLLAGLATLVISPTVIRTLNLEDVPPGAVRLAIGAVIGGFAQPIAILGQTRLVDILGRVFGGNKGTPNV